ncbi:MAG: hypothetical protein CL610_16615 [Anaerolineaceae bacterium]|nr:hypothetical protein [Anaerolineaceae bacterium]
MAKTESTIITLTLPPGSGSQRHGTLLIQRGELAQVSQFSFRKMSDITTAIHAAANTLAELEIDPPKLVEAKKTTGGKAKTDSKRKPETASTTQKEEALDDGAPEEDEADTDAEEENVEKTEVRDDPDQLPMLL